MSDMKHAKVQGTQVGQPYVWMKLRWYRPKTSFHMTHTTQRDTLHTTELVYIWGEKSINKMAKTNTDRSHFRRINTWKLYIYINY